MAAEPEHLSQVNTVAGYLLKTSRLTSGAPWSESWGSGEANEPFCVFDFSIWKTETPNVLLDFNGSEIF